MAQPVASILEEGEDSFTWHMAVQSKMLDIDSINCLVNQERHKLNSHVMVPNELPNH